MDKSSDKKTSDDKLVDSVVFLFVMILSVFLGMVIGYCFGESTIETKGIEERSGDKILVKCEDGHTEWLLFPKCKGGNNGQK
jgi:hypothetical protein